MTASMGLTRVPLPTLEDLLDAVERGRLACPFTVADLVDVGFRGPASDVIHAMGQANAASAAAMLRVAIAERVHRHPPRVDLVWSGPETRTSVARSTGLVVQGLFESATRSVIVGGYAFDTPEILEPLHRAMKERGVDVMLFVDIDGVAATAAGATAFATAHIDRFFQTVWVFGSPKPEVFYDPRTAAPGPPWASLHAKCIIVDDARSLITSANFTDRGQTRNIEAGVLIEDAYFAEELGGQWRKLVSAGMVKRYEG
jgi:phosphatidylserine/phosphatidylglycerophosphate/cardiolipin synthase-like enzyme